MNINEFTDKVVKAAQEVLGDEYRVCAKEVLKNNDTLLHGVMISGKDTRITPTIYVDNFLPQYEDGMPFGDIMSKIIGAFREGERKTDIDLSFFSEFDKVKDRICYRLLAVERNRELLEMVPYIPFLDLAIVFYYALDSETLGNASIMIRYEHMDMWETDVSTLMKLASENTPRLFPAGCKSLLEVLKEMLQERYPYGDEEIPMLVASNETRLQGASVILYPDFLEDVAGRNEANLFVIPSSVHEVLLLPDRGNLSSEMLRDLIRSVNSTSVDPVEVLSDNLYYFDRSEKQVRIIA
ncbi:MAG: DUF5688 family protein [Lachnospiraceae bacterium]|nr:DUF5688 family protein [Lachnospiraceae bacterium]